MHETAIGQHGFQLEHMIDRLAVEDRSCAAGIVGDHAADGCTIRGRDVRREQEAVGRKRQIQIIKYTAWLDANPAFLGVDLDARGRNAWRSRRSRPDRSTGRPVKFPLPAR